MARYDYRAGPPCPTGSKDCLTLNVYTEDATGKRGQYMVLIFCGAFFIGSDDSSMYVCADGDPKLSFGYMLGNLASDDSIISGNQED